MKTRDGDGILGNGSYLFTIERGDGCCEYNSFPSVDFLFWEETFNVGADREAHMWEFGEHIYDSNP